MAKRKTLVAPYVSCNFHSLHLPHFIYPNNTVTKALYTVHPTATAVLQCCIKLWDIRRHESVSSKNRRKCPNLLSDIRIPGVAHQFVHQDCSAVRLEQHDV